MDCLIDVDPLGHPEAWHKRGSSCEKSRVSGLDTGAWLMDSELLFRNWSGSIRIYLRARDIMTGGQLHPTSSSEDSEVL